MDLSEDEGWREGPGADRLDDTLRLAGGVEMNQRHLYRLAVGRHRSVEPPLVSGSLSEAKPTLAPQDASNRPDAPRSAPAVRARPRAPPQSPGIRRHSPRAEPLSATAQPDVAHCSG